MIDGDGNEYFNDNEGEDEDDDENDDEEEGKLLFNLLPEEIESWQEELFPWFLSHFWIILISSRNGHWNFLLLRVTV